MTERRFADVSLIKVAGDERVLKSQITQIQLDLRLDEITSLT